MTSKKKEKVESNQKNKSDNVELIIDLEDEHINDSGFFYLHPKYVNKMNFLKQNLFTACRIRNTPVEELNSNVIQLINEALKEGGLLEIFLSQPLSIMMDYDIRQLVSSLNLIGFTHVDSGYHTVSEESQQKIPYVSARKAVSNNNTEPLPKVKSTIKKSK